MGVIDIFRNIVLSIISSTAGQAANSMGRKSRQKNLTDEHKQKLADAKTQAEDLARMAESYKKN